MESESNLPPLIVIVGETASGKSALALKLAVHLGGEIICADSWTVRRELSIGTAKPNASERALIPHHLVDVVDACQPFNAALFKDLASRAIKDISDRGKVPIMVGGTGLYIDSVIFDFSFLPTAPAELRRELSALSLVELLDLANVRGIDTTNIDKRNKRRVLRALESNGALPSRRAALRSNTLLIGIQRSKNEIDDRIESRVAAMIAVGLKDETEELVSKYGWECEGLKGIGYKEWKEHFAGSQDLSKTTERITKNTRMLAKRQRTWFKRNPHINWICSFEESVDLVTTFLNKRSIKRT